MRKEILEALKLAEVLVPSFIRGLYQVILSGFDAAWNEYAEDDEDDSKGED